jgi:hypothetical protein
MRRSAHKGVSLIEFLIVISIFIITIGIVFQIFTSLNKEYKVLVSYLSAYLKGRETIDRISKDCRIAIRVMDDHSGYTTTDNTLVLKVPSIDGSNNIIDVNNEFDYIIYRIQGGDLWKTVIPGGSSLREAFNGVLRRSMQSLYITSYGTPLSGIPHKSSVTALTLRVTFTETVLGTEYKVEPGTTVKLMNYEWRFVR